MQFDDFPINTLTRNSPTKRIIYVISAREKNESTNFEFYLFRDGSYKSGAIEITEFSDAAGALTFPEFSSGELFSFRPSLYLYFCFC